MLSSVQFGIIGTFGVQFERELFNMRLLTPNLKYFFITSSEADALWGEFIIPLDERKDLFMGLSFSSNQSESLLYRMLCCSLFRPTQSYTIRQKMCV